MACLYQKGDPGLQQDLAARKSPNSREKIVSDFPITGHQASGAMMETDKWQDSPTLPEGRNLEKLVSQ